MDKIFLLALVITFVAYFVKGFSGFGPALILIPSFTLLYNPVTAIAYSTIFDAIAGILLLVLVIKNIDWKFVLPIIMLMFAGAYFGVMFITRIPVQTLKLLIGIVLVLFIIILLSEREDRFTFVKNTQKSFVYGMAFLAGFIGGITGITGPILVIIFKLKFEREAFRSQLIAIFTMGALWRLYLYYSHQLIPEFKAEFIYMVIIVLIALGIGHLFQNNMDEKRFNRYISFILIIPAVNLFIDVLKS